MHPSSVLSPKAPARTWRPVVALSAWTVFVWSVRIKNALTDDTITSSGRFIALLTSLGFIGAAAALVVAHRNGHPWARRGAAAFAVVTIAYWLIRLATIVVRGHSVGFVVVHAVLAAVFVGLGSWVVRSAGGGTGGAPWGRTPV